MLASGLWAVRTSCAHCALPSSGLHAVDSRGLFHAGAAGSLSLTWSWYLKPLGITDHGLETEDPIPAGIYSACLQIPQRFWASLFSLCNGDPNIHLILRVLLN